MAQFALKNNFLEFNGQIKQQISGTTLGIKCAPACDCICMMEVEFLEKQEYKSFTWFRYFNDIFFYWTHGEDNLKFSKIPSTRKDNTKGLLLVVTYHPGLKNIDQIINRNLHLLYMDQEVRKAFTPKPMVSLRSARKFCSYLVRAKIYPLERNIDSFKCKGKR